VRVSLLTSLVKFVLQFEASQTAPMFSPGFFLFAKNESKFPQLVPQNVTATRETLVPSFCS